MATDLDRLARLHYYERQYAEAEPLWRRSLAIREKALGLDHPDVATNLYDLAMLFQVQSMTRRRSLSGSARSRSGRSLSGRITPIWP